ncbi:hypothetical protein ACJMK2_006650 [Sinanodonta woodiana]|uniref:Homeobox domain-containing protein n=1 Tax=Sinanodonta woodiana TaxID=1069815 RepID=A0ABD3VTW2_SINWO
MPETKPEVDGSESPEEKTQDNLSFSISRILGDDGEKKESRINELEISSNCITPNQPQYCPIRGMVSTMHRYGQVHESSVGHHNRMIDFRFSYPMIPLENSFNRFCNLNSPPVREPRPNCTCAKKEQPDSDCNFCARCDHPGNEKSGRENTKELCEISKDSSETVSSKTASNDMKSKKKKTRTVFSRSQVYQLENAFDMKRYLSSAERSGLAARLNLSETQIKIWFQNRRNKWKRQINGEMDEISPSSFPHIHGALHSSAFHSPNLNRFHAPDSREELLLGGMAAPALYSHPYANEMIPRY